MLSFLYTLFSFALLVHARDIIITVGGNTTENPGAVFSPQSVTADLGDVVIFNFTQGNHTAIQALFGSPCIPAHEIDSTVNGFNSGFRDAGNFSAITQLSVPITDPNATLWFYDYNTCAEGGVGGINVNESSWETLDGFTRNAIRLNGTGGGDASSTLSRTSRPTSTGSSDGSEPTEEEGAARRAMSVGVYVVAPLLALAAVF
ncbi:hypothetical protein CC1G_12089 [Coprinopsis cinerea okayama7|uniref:Extracellular serine-rich protein n=1 Tax=Coprinopsis cinerea (strain Okayama-7 / 130 / ATCC MYA-4618 / FGSC 9003) TaxID=240176 RepID=A8N5Q7_COPC7|nr:hypothetical protein CC1G_12089 [Coprinopsis cinerea okayama7\|eukprot:XP_001830202.1 hypothetical protein CC1G_12089 [Coprinopsis cinerea okayama7\